MNLQSIMSAIYTWASANVAIGTTIYWDNPNAPRPEAPSIRLKIFGGPGMIGLDEIRDVEGNADQFKIVGPRTLSLSVNAYGDSAQQACSDLVTSLSDPDSQATLDAGGVSTLETSDVRDLSELMDTKFEQRFQFDVDLLTTEEKTIEPGVIEEVEGTGTVGGHSVPIEVSKT